MLSVEEEMAQLTDYICMDHCYTSFSPFSAHTTSSMTNQRCGSVSSNDQNFDPPVTATVTSTESAIRTRGRGRRPGRPRKDVSIARSSPYRGVSTRSVGVVRRARCDGETGTSIPPGMVTVQQIKPLNPPSTPSSSPLPASLVPLIKPLVMKLDKQLSAAVANSNPGQMKMQKRVIAVPMKNGGTRLVTITGTNLGQVLTGSQRRVLIANNRSLQDSQTSQQQLQKEQNQQQQRQKQQNKEADIANCNSWEEENDDTDVSDSESNEQDPDDEDYVVPGWRQRKLGSKHRKENNLICNGRTQSSHQPWDSENVPKVEEVEVKRRRGKSPREQNKSEDREEVLQPETETMTGLISIDRFPEKEESERTIGHDENSAPKVIVNEAGQEGSVLYEADSSLRKNTIKDYGKDNGKENILVNQETDWLEREVTSQTQEHELLTNSSLSKNSVELTSSVSQSTHASIGMPRIERKHHHKHENRKSPAHLAEVLTPGLHTSRNHSLSADSEKKTSTSQERLPVESEATSEEKFPKRVTTSLQEEGTLLYSPASPEPESTLPVSLNTDLQVPNHQGLLNKVNVDANKRGKGSTETSSLAQQHIGNEEIRIEADTLSITEARVPETKPEEPSSCTEINAVVPSEAEFSTATVKSSAKMPATSLAAANKFTRKRGSTGKRKKEVARSSFQKQQTSVRERRKSNEGKNNQAKGRKRRRSSETSTKVQLDERDEESEAETDESWNSEDDPDRLWCICKKPHNNCFMICCDSCEDWFHGKCVGVTKNMGKQMELNGVEWVCPNCSKKKEIEEKEREAQKLAKSSKEKEVKKTATKQSLQKETVKNLKENSNDDVSATSSPVQKPKASTTINGKSNCLICKNEAQPGSMYCSEACIVKHNQEPVYGYPERKSSSEIQVTHGIESSVSIQPQVLEQSEDVSSLVASTTTELPRPNTDNRICMSHLAGSEDPTVENVKTLLCNHPASFQMRPDVAAAAATAAMFHIHNTERRQTHMQDEEMPALQSNLISFQSRSTVQPVETVTMERVPIPTPTITNNSHLVQLAESATSPIVSSVIVSRDDAVSRIVFKVDHGVQYPNGTTAGNTTILDENLLNDGKRTAEMKKTETLEVKTEEENNVSDREPSSTVKIRIPEINYDGSPSLGSVVMDRLVGACATVWKGYVNIPDVARFFTTVQVVSGDSQNLCRDLPDTVDIVGRIIPEIAWDYISKMKRCVTKEILVLRLTAANDEEKIPYIALFTYLNIKNSIGVVGNVSKMIKDFYIMPLASNKPVPQVLLPLNGPGFEDFRPHLLLGILVRTRRKRPPSEPSFMVKIPKYFSPPEATERSYTPPLPVTGTHTPPYPPPALIVSRGNNIDNYTH